MFHFFSHHHAEYLRHFSVCSYLSPVPSYFPISEQIFKTFTIILNADWLRAVLICTYNSTKISRHCSVKVFCASEKKHIVVYYLQHVHAAVLYQHIQLKMFPNRCYRRKYITEPVNYHDLLEKQDKKISETSKTKESLLYKFLPRKKKLDSGYTAIVQRQLKYKDQESQFQA